MKLKYEFSTQKVGQQWVAVAVGDDADEFTGILKLNETAAFMFDRLARDITPDELQAATLAWATNASELSPDQVATDVEEFLQVLREAGLLIE